MAKEIVNRVAQSKLITFDLEELYEEGARATLDIAQWLDQGIVLREKSFRESVKNHNYCSYQDAFVALRCSTDAILPAWAFMLVASQLNGIAKRTIVGDIETLETVLYTEKINQLDTTPFENKSIIVKGCTNKAVPDNAYILLIEKLQDVAISIMFGEACSAVPLFKKKQANIST